MKTFSEKVRDARAELGISQSALAEKVGVSLRTILSYETTDSRPRAGPLIKLAKALNISAGYLKNDDITDPSYGLETQNYIEETRQRFGIKGAKEIDALLQLNVALFAGGDLPQESKDAYFEAVMKAYITAKEEARKTFGHKNKNDET
jgi:transcriptional regulator with XRE-family HTH domain